MIKRSLRLAIILSPALVACIIFGPVASLLYIILLGIAAFGKVLYLSSTFNDCQSAAESLKKEIVEARLDLSRKGFNFVTQ